MTVQAQILELILELRDSSAMAILLITHDLGVVAEVADDVAVMYAGKIVETGPVADVFAAPQHPYTEALMRSTPLLGMRYTAHGCTRSAGRCRASLDMPSGCRFRARCEYALRALRATSPTFPGRQPGSRPAGSASTGRAPVEPVGRRDHLEPVTGYAVRRILIAVPTLCRDVDPDLPDGRLMPGNVIDFITGGTHDDSRREQRHQMEHQLGLDQSYLAAVLALDQGHAHRATWATRSSSTVPVAAHPADGDPDHDRADRARARDRAR